jgi:TetR/AcrR family transcriptional regulator, regulator of autoinduction and epiphytic fitness
VPRRAYHAPNRAAAADRTRRTILTAAKVIFEDLGWARTTMPAIAGSAGVSVKTVEAHFGTKAKLLAEVVSSLERVEVDIEATRHFQNAVSAMAAIPSHAKYATPVVARTARIAAVVDEAAATDGRLEELAARMRNNRRYGAHWAAKTIMGRRGLAPDLTFEEAERVFLFATDPATYRTLTGELGLDDDGVREWMVRYERGMLLLRT